MIRAIKVRAAGSLRAEQSTWSKRFQGCPRMMSGEDGGRLYEISNFYQRQAAQARGSHVLGTDGSIRSECGISYTQVSPTIFDLPAWVQFTIPCSTGCNSLARKRAI